MDDHDSQFERIRQVVGDDETLRFDEGVKKYYEHLKNNLTLPCEVTGREDFEWEEPYVVANWDQDEYNELKKVQPSYTDKFELLDIELGACSMWMMFHTEDIGANVRRKSDGRKFCLGLAELEVTDKESLNYQLIRDYGVWFTNSR